MWKTTHGRDTHTLTHKSKRTQAEYNKWRKREIQNSRTLMGTETQIPVGQNKHNKEENSRIEKLKESAFIHCTDHVISQLSIDISPILLPIIRPEIKKKNL